MAWIKFEAARVKRLEKFYEFRREMGWSVVEALGFLGAFWGEAIEVCESGDVTGWTPGYLSERVGLSGNVSEKAWEALGKHGWLDRKGDRLLIHDWVDTAGTYLRKRYGGGGAKGRARLAEIWALHSLTYGPESECVTQKGPVSDQKVSLDKSREDEKRAVTTDGAAPAARPAAFKPPTLEEVKAYCLERKNAVDPEKWMNHYTANGWMVGRTKMKDWRAAVRTWEGSRPSAGRSTARVGAPAGKYAGIGERHEV